MIVNNTQVTEWTLLYGEYLDDSPLGQIRLAAHSKGSVAYFEGFLLESNPYVPDSLEYLWFMRGWQQAAIDERFNHLGYIS